MSTRQYIGARYVPKFFDWGGSAEWRSGVAYEALTIVTRNGNSYTSKIPVPSNVGAPESNPDYWVSTGLFNEQIESIRQLAEGTASDLASFMSNGAIGTNNLANDAVTADKIADNAVGTDQIANGAVTTDKIYSGAVESNNLANNCVIESKIANGAVTTEKIPDNAITVDKVAPRYIINVGDSYQEGYDPGGNNQGWGYYLLNMFGYTGHNIQGVGGAGFGAGANSQYDFTTILTDNPPTGIDADKVTDIVVGGGYNDFNRTQSDIRAGIARFYTYCKTTYPNAKIWLAPVGWAWTNNGDSITPAKVGGTYRTYMDACKDKDIIFINSCVGILLGCNGLSSSDYKHPNETGNKAIASAINAAFNGQEYTVAGGEYTLPITTTNWVGSIIASVVTHGGLATINFGYQGVTYDGPSTGVEDFTINFAHHPFMCLLCQRVGSIVRYDSKYANTPVSFGVQRDGSCHLGFQLVNEAGTAFQAASYINIFGGANGNTTFTVNCVNAI